MAKQRRKRPKRTKTQQDRQERLLLKKHVRETFAGSEAFDDAADWDADWAAREPAAARRPDPSIEPDPRAPAADRDGRRGRVVAVSSGACRIETAGETADAVLPSNLAREQRSAVAVGDEVWVDDRSSPFRVAGILPRRSTLSRPDPLNPRLERVLAANVDLVVLVSSVVRPPLRPALIDRAVIAAERGGATALLCVNKIDLLESGEVAERELAPLDAYRDAGLEISRCSARRGDGITELRQRLADRTAVFVGHSGVGKSSLVNALAEGLRAATAAVRRSGRHTTTRSSLYHLDPGISVIDTPGIREFGLLRLTPRELRFYFPDFDDLALACRFGDCTHSHEPDCAVRRAVTSGSLPAERHATYLRILETLESQS